MIRYSHSPRGGGPYPDLPQVSSRPWHVVALFFGRYWFQLSLFSLLALWWGTQRHIHVTIEIAPGRAALQEQIAQAFVWQVGAPANLDAAVASDSTPSAAIGSPREHVVWEPKHFGNLTFVLDPDFARRNSVPRELVEMKLDNCKRYIERFARVAIAEMEKYGVPASITLAQALLESDAGASKLARESNNHFGIKCRPRCLECTCRNYADDDRYDMFRVFHTAWESFRAHSRLMHDERYRHLLQYGTDYRKWAEGLEAAGYATDPQYAEKLIQIVEYFDLYLFDRRAA